MVTHDKSICISKQKVIEGGLVVRGDLTGSQNLWIEGDLTVFGSVAALGNIIVTGNVTVDRDIRGTTVMAGGNLVATRGTITASGRIQVKGSLTAGRAVEAQGSIWVGGPLTAGWWVVSNRYEIVCSELRTSQLPFGRNFWAAQPILARWRHDILDPTKCWKHWRTMFTEAERAEFAKISFGHWWLDGQVRNFLGLTTRCVPPESNRPEATAWAPRPATAPAPPRPTPSATPTDPNPLLAIFQQPADIPPFPNYSNDPQWQAILNACSGTDPRQYYTDVAVNLSTVSYWIGKLPTSPAVTGILNELNMAMNVRSLTAAHNTFLNTVFIDSQALLGDVGEYVSAESDDACNFDMLSVFKDVLSALSVVPEIGGVFTVFGAVVGLLEVGVGGGLSDISVEYNVLWNSLLTNYNNAVAANTQMATIFLTDYNKMMGVNNLILQQVVSWPIDNQLAIDMATNRYVINLYKVLLPLHWWPTYSYNTFNENTLDGCGNTVWMQYGGWGCVQQNQDYVPYWLTFGGLWWADLTNCENMLANVGVSIEDLTMGTGLWGSEIWAWNRGQNALGQDQEPSCVAKN